MEKPLPFPPDVKAALDEFDSWGAVVDHVLFFAPDLVDEYAHERAAKSGLLNVINERKLKITFDLSKLEAVHAEKQTLQQFFGENFDVTTRKPLFRFPNALFPHPFDDEENAHLRRGFIVEPDDFNDESTRGYARAILDPPYRLYRQVGWWQNKNPLLPIEIGTKFLELCDALFGDLTELQIYDWPTDCSTYFEPGYEWWGSSFWTVYVPSKNWIVVILASATD